MTSWSGQDLIRLLIFGLLYALAAFVVQWSILLPQDVAALGPSSGVFLAALLLTPRAQWWGTIGLLGGIDFVMTYAVGGFPVLPAGLFSIILVGEAWVGARLVLWHREAPLRLASFTDVLVLLVRGCMVAVGLFAGAGALVNHVMLGGVFWSGLWQWWVNGALGVIVITPLLLTWWPDPLQKFRSIPPAKRVELVLMLVAIALVTRVAFTVENPPGAAIAPFAFLVLPLLGWIAVRFRPGSTALASFIFSVAALYYDFVDGLASGGLSGQVLSILTLQAFLFIFVASSLMLSALLLERDQVTNDLALSWKRFERALDQVPDVVVIYDPDLRIQYINAATTAITGRPPDDFIGHREEDLWPPEVYGVYLPTLEAARDTRTIQRLETTLDLPHGGSRDLVITCIPLFNEDEALVEVMGVTHDITEQERAAKTIRQISRRLLNAQEEERRRLAQEMHDEMGGLLTTLQMTLEMQAAGISAPPEEDSPLALVERLMDEVRTLARALRPRVLDDLGLGAALTSYVSTYQRMTGIQVHVHQELEPGERFERETELTAYRVIQESLTNVARHAGVKDVQVLLHRDPSALVLHVIDEGKGFDVDLALASEHSMGLLGIQERMMLLEGTFEVVSEENTGTRITIHLPL